MKVWALSRWCMRKPSNGCDRRVSTLETKTETHLLFDWRYFVHGESTSSAINNKWKAVLEHRS